MAGQDHIQGSNQDDGRYDEPNPEDLEQMEKLLEDAANYKEYEHRFSIISENRPPSQIYSIPVESIIKLSSSSGLVNVLTPLSSDFHY